MTEQIMQASGIPDTKFMHCVPSVDNRSTELGQRLFDQCGLDGAEVTDDVFQR